ncbi:unnamed protein product [Closterium sp. NIES-53]
MNLGGDPVQHSLLPRAQLDNHGAAAAAAAGGMTSGERDCSSAVIARTCKHTTSASSAASSAPSEPCCCTRARSPLTLNDTMRIASRARTHARTDASLSCCNASKGFSDVSETL